jgi:hypothetical protein
MRRDRLEVDPSPVIALEGDEIGKHQRRNGVNEVDPVEQDKRIGQKQQDKQDAQNPAREVGGPARRYRLALVFIPDIAVFRQGGSAWCLRVIVSLSEPASR